MVSRPLIQPDATTCGSAVVVLARLIADPLYANTVLRADDPLETFAAACLDAHRRSAAWTIGGRPQVPWPRKWGTRPDSLARLMAVSGGAERLVVRRSAIVDPRNPKDSYDAVVAAVVAGWPVPMFIGSRLLPRHVVLVVRADDEQLSLYDPSCGQEQQRSRAAFVDGHLDVAGWAIPWLAVVPYSEVEYGPVIEWTRNTPGLAIRRRRLRASQT